MPERISLPEDYLRIGEPAANRRSVFSAIMEALRDEERDSVIPRGAVRGEITTPEQRRAALTTRLEIPPKIATRPEATEVDRTAPRAGAIRRREAAPSGEGFIEWIDERGVRHVTDKPETVPEGVEAKVIPFEEPTLEVGGQKLFGEPTPEALGVLRKAAETDEQREDRLIGEIMKETGKGRGEVTKAFRGARREITGEPEKPKTYEAKVARRDEAVANVERLIKQNPEDRSEILRQFSQKMKLEGLTDIKKPEETVAIEVEGQKKSIPLKDYDPKKHGKGAAKADVSTVVTNFESVTGTGSAARGSDEYKKSFFKWREKLTGKKPKSIDDEIFDVYLKTLKSDPDLANDPVEWKEIEDGIRAQAKRLKGTKKPAPDKKVTGITKRRLPDGRVLVKDAQGNITVEG